MGLHGNENGIEGGYNDAQGAGRSQRKPGADAWGDPSPLMLVLEDSASGWLFALVKSRSCGAREKARGILLAEDQVRLGQLRRSCPVPLQFVHLRVPSPLRFRRFLPALGTGWLKDKAQKGWISRRSLF